MSRRQCPLRYVAGPKAVIPDSAKPGPSGSARRISALGRFTPFVGSPRITAWDGEEIFFTMLRSDQSLELEAPLGGFSVDKILGLAMPLGLFTQAEDMVE
jgi:hypothetical protein